MKTNNRKKYMHIDCEMGSSKIFALIDKIENETKNVIENDLEDSDMEYIAEEPIPDNKE